LETFAVLFADYQLSAASVTSSQTMSISPSLTQTQTGSLTANLERVTVKDANINRLWRQRARGQLRCQQWACREHEPTSLLVCRRLRSCVWWRLFVIWLLHHKLKLIESCLGIWRRLHCELLRWRCRHRHLFAVFERRRLQPCPLCIGLRRRQLQCLQRELLLALSAIVLSELESHAVIDAHADPNA